MCDGVLRLELCSSRHRVTLTLDLLREIERRLTEVEALARSGEAEVVVVGTGGSAIDVLGYDPSEIRQLEEEDLVAWSHEGQVILGHLEELPIPTVADVGGRWWGAGLELALACSYRVALPGDAVRLAMPQRRLGVIPGWGGTVRLPRLIGLGDALGMMLGAEPVDPEEARSIGLIDAMMPALLFAERLRSFETRRPRRDRDSAWGRKGLRRRLLEQTLPGRQLSVRRADRRSRDTGPPDLVSREVRALIVDNAAAAIQRALAHESATLGRLSRDPTTRARLHASWVLDAATASELPEVPLPDSAAVVGGGQTGGDIAHLLVTAGIRVRLKDSRRERLREGIQQARRRLSWERVQGRISEAQAQDRSGQLAGGTGFGGFGTVDLLVAVTEGASERSAERIEDLLTGSEPHVRPDCVIAYHDWTASADSLAATLRQPHRLIGITPHFPADRFPLLELSTSSTGSDRAAAVARRIAAELGIVVVEAGGVIPTPGIRLLGSYFAEALRLLGEGARVDQVDEALEGLGFSVGPFRRMDALGTPRVQRMLASLESAGGPGSVASPVLSALARDFGTFYRYRNGEPLGPSRDLPRGLSPDGGAVGELVRRRMLLLLSNEAARILSEPRTIPPHLIDATALLALGYPRQLGGPLFNAEAVGFAQLAQDLDRAAARWGDRYAPAAPILELARAAASLFSPPSPRSSGQRETPVLT